MIVTNIGTTCVILSFERVYTQPALRPSECSLLRTLSSQDKHTSLFTLAAAAQLTYASAWTALYSLEGRGLVSIHRNGSGLTVKPLASLLEDIEQ